MKDKVEIDVFFEDKKNYELFIGFKEWTDKRTPFLMKNFSVKTGFLKGTGHSHVHGNKTGLSISKSIKKGNVVLLVGDFDGKLFNDKIDTFLEQLSEELKLSKEEVKKRFFMIGTDDEPEQMKTAANLHGKTKEIGKKLAKDWFCSSGVDYWDKYLCQCKHETERLCSVCNSCCKKTITSHAS